MFILGLYAVGLGRLVRNQTPLFFEGLLFLGEKKIKPKESKKE